MTYQERQEIISIGILYLLISYVISIAIGLNILSNGIQKEIKPVTIHTSRLFSENIKTLPVLPKEKPVIDEDLKLLSHIINAEAGDQPYKGKVAVGNVIMNRIASPEFPDTIRDVVYQKGQFSPVSNGSINNKPNDESIQAAKDVLNGSRVVSKDVLYFYDPVISTSKWIFTREVVAKIGDHAFAL